MMQTRLASSLASLAAAAATCVAVTASAQVAQPDGSLVPDQTASGDYFDPARYTVDTLGLGTMLDLLENGLVDYQADAATDPATFSPLCGLQGSMIMRGGSCRMDFGWYCVGDPPTSNTDPRFVPLVTSEDVIEYHDALPEDANPNYRNTDKGFVPLIGLDPVEGEPLEAVREHPVFESCASKQIGFAIMPTGEAIPTLEGKFANPAICTQPKYSQRELSTTHAASGQPWINALVYASRIRPGVFYIAFEDLPNSSTSFIDPASIPSEWDTSADYDFNDFVYMVEGIQCEGGGQICNTGLPGICSVGVTECTVDGTPGACSPKFEATAEVCDNIDNDCDGFIDGDGLCPAETPRCFQGNCVKNCGGGEFACPGDYVCDSSTDLCVKADCVGITCGEGEVCRGGVCQGSCVGVTCPAGQDCISGTCLDLCQGQTCPEGFVCQSGACIASCLCLPCAAGFTCGADGKCVDQACEGVTCDPGLACRQGVCVNPCDGVTCPVGQVCTVVDNDAVCLGGTGTETNTSTDPNSTNTNTSFTITDTGGTGTHTSTDPNNNNGEPQAPSSGSGCDCQSASRRGAGMAGLAGLILLGVAFARRRYHS